MRVPKYEFLVCVLYCYVELRSFILLCGFILLKKLRSFILLCGVFRLIHLK